MQLPSRSPASARAVATTGTALAVLVVSAFVLGFRPGDKAVPAEAARPAAFPHAYALANAKIGHWAPVVANVPAHSRPSAASPTVARLTTVTGDWTQNIVLVIRRVDVSPRETWYEVRLPILP